MGENINNNVIKFKRLGFSPISKNDKCIVLKSGKGIVVCNFDNSYEGFIHNKSIDELVKSIDESKTSEILGLVTLIGTLMTYFTTDVTIVDGECMCPTYKNYELILKSKSVRNVNKILISKNTIIKFKSPDGDQSIKRVVGMPGDKIKFDIKTMALKINDKAVAKYTSDHYKSKPDDQSYEDYNKYLKGNEEYILKSNQYFVMGDNRGNSIDSRKYGPVDYINIIAVIEK